MNRTHIARIKQSFKTAEQILHEDMIASITEDYQESTSRPTLVPQYVKKQNTLKKNFQIFSEFCNCNSRTLQATRVVVSDSEETQKLFANLK